MSRIALLVLNAFVAVAAIGGAIWVVPTMPLEWMRAGPFEDWTVPAIALGLVGVLSGMAALAVGIRPWLGGLLSIAAGAAMIIFELVEIAVVGWTLSDPRLNGSPQAWLQAVFLVVGAGQLLFGVALWLRRRSEAPPMPLLHPSPT
jgi:hypothetical protein